MVITLGPDLEAASNDLARQQVRTFCPNATVPSKCLTSCSAIKPSRVSSRNGAMRSRIYPRLPEIERDYYNFRKQRR